MDADSTFLVEDPSVQRISRANEAQKAETRRLAQRLERGWIEPPSFTWSPSHGAAPPSPAYLNYLAILDKDGHGELTAAGEVHSFQRFVIRFDVVLDELAASSIRANPAFPACTGTMQFRRVPVLSHASDTSKNLEWCGKSRPGTSCIRGM